MNNIVILGSGTAGTMIANRLTRRIRRQAHQIIVVDKQRGHYYQPGFLFLPFGLYTERDLVRPQQRFLLSGVRYLEGEVDRIEPENNQVLLCSGESLAYEILIIATGVRIAPEQIDGMLGPDWRRRIFDFYTLSGAVALQAALQDFRGGRLVTHVCEMPIKCPVAPLEFAFLADAWLRQRGLRHKTELVYLTPLSGAFTKPVASRFLQHLLAQKKIEVVSDFNVARVDHERHKIIAWDGRTEDYDLLVTVPTNLGDESVARSGLGDELNYVPTDRYTLQSKLAANIFVIGDATDLPTSKAGSVAHFEAEVLADNILRFLHSKPLVAGFDGHANCFVESGHGKAVLLDFNYDLQPVGGSFPFPVFGPFSLLQESRRNHWGKLMFKWIYWNALLKGLPLPGISAQLSRTGKRIPPELLKPQPV